MKKTDNVKNTTNVKKNHWQQQCYRFRRWFTCAIYLWKFMIDIESSTTPKKNRIIYIDMEILKYLYTTVISMFCCRECNWSRLNLPERFMKKKWLASLLVIQLYIYLALIVNMKWEYYTSKSCGKGYDINCRTMYTMCTCAHVDKVIVVSKDFAIQ